MHSFVCTAGLSVSSDCRLLKLEREKQTQMFDKVPDETNLITKQSCDKNLHPVSGANVVSETACCPTNFKHK